MMVSMCAGSCSEEGAARLVYDGVTDPDKGRLEICANGQWGTVCGDGPTDDDGFDIDAARVVCRQLGVEESGELLVHSIIDKCTNRDKQFFLQI